MRIPNVMRKSLFVILYSIALGVFLFTSCMVSNILGLLIFIALLFILSFTYQLTFKNSLLAQANNDLFKFRVINGLMVPRHNKELVGALNTTQELFSVAMEEILIQAGNLDHEFYENDTIVDALRDFLAVKNHNVRLICAPQNECNGNTRKIFALQQEFNLNFQILHDKQKPEVHFMVVDSRHFRLEKKHLPGECYEADILYNGNLMADFYKHQFAHRWNEIEKSSV